MIEETLRGSMQDLFAAHERQAHGYTLSWSGELLQPPARAVRLLEARFKPYGYTPFLKRDKAGTWVRAVPLAVVAERSRGWISVALFVLTLLSTLAAGCFFATGSIPFLTFNPLRAPLRLLEGLPFAATLLAILGTHEFGHYFTAKAYGASVSPPYFIPAPPPLFLFGTLGAGAHGMMVVPVDVGFGLVVFVLLILRRHLSARAGARVPSPDRARAMVPEVAVTVEDEPGPASDFEDGVRNIRKTDPGFDPTRFVGYTGMIFRDVHRAWMTRDIASLRPRLTPDMYGALVAQCERLRDAHRSNRVDAVDVQTEITEAWQETGRDFVTAYVVGSMIDYTVDDASDAPVEGSRAVPRDVSEFWTFTRPAGLNFWMLSAIQAA